MIKKENDINIVVIVDVIVAHQNVVYIIISLKIKYIYVTNVCFLLKIVPLQQRVSRHTVIIKDGLF